MHNVKDYAAVGDGKRLDSTCIQDAIDACFKAGGGVMKPANWARMDRVSGWVATCRRLKWGSKM